MTARTTVRIDERKCNGCGACIPECAEGALRIVDGKARLDRSRCDGLGACLRSCPQGAITAVEEARSGADRTHAPAAPPPAMDACPGLAAVGFGPPQGAARSSRGGAPTRSLRQWPVQLALVPETAPFLRGADVLLVADCVPFALPGVHEQLMSGRRILVACPKLDDARHHERKLAAILREAGCRSLTVAHMEVPCCGGLWRLAERAALDSGATVPLEEVEVGIRGDVVVRPAGATTR